MDSALRAAAAKRAWETIRARRAAGFYEQPREPKVKTVKPPMAVRCEVGKRFLMARTDCKWQNARFQGLAGGADGAVCGAIEPDKAAGGYVAAAAVAVDRRQLQRRTGDVFVPIFPAVR